MDPHLPFLKAIAATPADDLPRLVYADYLEETGQPVHVARAHFIRGQIALESLKPRSREHRKIKDLEQRLLDLFVEFWLFDLPHDLRADGRVTWRRGFPDGIRVGLGFPDDWGRWLNPEWFELHPVREIQIERVWGRGTDGWAARFRWTHITTLRVGPGVIPNQLTPFNNEQAFLDHLFQFPEFTFNRLDLSQNLFQDPWLVRFLARIPEASFANTLTELDLSHCYQLTDAGANILATARGLERLKVLRLDGVPLSPSAVAMLRNRFGDGLQV